MNKIFAVGAFVLSFCVLSACGQGDQVAASQPQDPTPTVQSEHTNEADITTETTKMPLGSFDEIREATWVLQNIDGKTPETMAPITIQFGADGRVHGVGGCNGYNTSYMMENGDLKINSMIAATMMVCDNATMKQESRYHDLLGDVSKWSQAEDGTLVLETAKGKRMVFEKK